MNLYNHWSTRFASLSPVMQVLIMVSLGAVLADAMAAAFFMLGGYTRLDRTIYLTTIIVFTVGGPLCAFLVSWNYRLKQMTGELDIAFRKDGMTGLYTRHEFYLRVSHFIQASNPVLSAGAVLYVDVDHLKQINDRYGHAVGDDIVLDIGILIREMMGRRDVGARFGGEEFAVFLADADYGQAAWVANRILAGCRAVTRRAGDRDVSITVSIGVAFHAPGQKLEQLVDSADQCLYLAKNQGRDRIIFGPAS
ncbi:GGDEF domain-containing protein [Phyllobacterium sp. YR531]|uniref:GGDEF domain-containing protein n=1 Tax=Phyllobacterium sp. YR531 TaxID=1144343 RepID=UPI00026F5AF2|nr:GGDEF domain-containing protein [Phyllobacterium sp. YR531]EJN05642.1 diguanylate cyclase (GGDEF) domain-containing protein [Phyllobacterium sp. YR531]